MTPCFNEDSAASCCKVAIGWSTWRFEVLKHARRALPGAAYAWMVSWLQQARRFHWLPFEAKASAAVLWLRMQIPQNPSPKHPGVKSLWKFRSEFGNPMKQIPWTKSHSKTSKSRLSLQQVDQPPAFLPGEAIWSQDGSCISDEWTVPGWLVMKNGTRHKTNFQKFGDVKCAFGFLTNKHVEIYS